jgi:thiol-disulfide isomerase/thioredoxin
METGARRAIYRRAAILAAIMLVCCARASAAQPDEVQPPRNAIILFVAAWCAPCHGEMRALPEIAASAAPMRVFVVTTDDTRGTARMMVRVPDDRRWRLSPGDAGAVMRRLAGTAPGLPISVAIDATGKVCAVVRKPLSADLAAGVRTRCRVSAT